jgi:hypothetical protein
MATKKITPLMLEEIASNGGFTHIAIVTADDLTEATANTAQDVSLGTVPKGWIINKTMARLVVPFEDKSDAAFNTTALVVGDAGSANRYITSAQMNRNGTEITIPQYNNTAYQTTAATEILANFAAMSAKSLVNIDKGEVHIFFQLIDTAILSELQSGATIVK